VNWKPSRPADALAHAASLVDVLLTALLLGWAATEAHPLIDWLFSTVGVAPVVIASPIAVGLILKTGRTIGEYFDVPPRWQTYALLPVAGLLTTHAVRNVYLLSQTGLPESFTYQPFALTAAATVAVASIVYTRAWTHVSLPSRDSTAVTATVALLATTAVVVGFIALPQNNGPVQNSSAQTSGTVIEDFEDGATEWCCNSAASVVTSPVWEGDQAYQLSDTDTTSTDSGDRDISAISPDSFSYRVNSTTSGQRTRIRLESSGGSIIAIQTAINGTTVYETQSENNAVATFNNNEWYQIQYENIDFSADTYDIVVRADNGTVVGSSENVAFENSVADFDTLYLSITSGTYVYDAFEANGAYSDYYKPDVAGTVETEGGAPVANATVVVDGIDFSQLNGTIEDKNERADELEALANDPIPQEVREFDNGSGLEFAQEERDAKYVAAHSPKDWQINDPISVPQSNYTLRDPTLGRFADDGPYGGTTTAPAGQTIILSLWDGREEGLIEDQTESDLYGGTTDGEITIRRLGPGGGENVLNEYTVNTTESVGGEFVANEHKFATVRLQIGYYEIEPADGGAPLVLTVGDPSETLLTQWRTDLKSQSGAALERANTLDELRSNGTLRNQTVTTNESGYFEADLAADVNRVNIIAYKGPADINKDPRNQSVSDIEGYYNDFDVDTEDPSASDSLPESTYLSGPRNGYSPPERNATITVKEFGVSPGSDTETVQELESAFREYFRNQDWADLGAIEEKYLQNSSREELEATYNTTVDLTTDENNQLYDWVDLNQTEENLVVIREDPSGLSRSELTATILILQRAHETRQPAVPEPETDPLPGENNSVLGATFEFAGEYDADDVQVFAEFTNGTARVVENQYITVQSARFAGIGDGTEVRIEDYPAPSSDTVGVTFRVQVANADGPGEGEIPVRNPQFSGSIDKLQYIDFSTLSPAAGESVNVRVAPEDGDPAALQSVTLTGPNGNGEGANVTDNTGAVTPQAAGTTTVDVTYQSGDNAAITESIDIDVLRNDIDEPATIRAERGFGGLYAVSGADLSGGDIATRAQNSRTNVLALVPAGQDPPTVVHTHVSTIDQPTTAETCTQLATQTDQTNVEQRTSVVTHYSPLGEDSYVYRQVDGELQPITQDGSRYGSVRHTENGTTVSTVTESDGGVCIQHISDPGLRDDIRWRIQQLQERVPGV